MDVVTVKHWKAYSDAPDAMPPGHVGKANDKRLAGLNMTLDIPAQLHCSGKKKKLIRSDAEIAFGFTPDCITAKWLAR